MNVINGTEGEGAYDSNHDAVDALSDILSSVRLEKGN